jgi:dTDP-glucose pyrophosphorylase
MFGYYVNDPERYSVAEFDSKGIAVYYRRKVCKTKI